MQPLPFARRLPVTRLVSGGTGEEAEVFARSGRLHVDGTSLAFVDAYAVERNAEDHEPNTVRVVGEGLVPLVDIAVSQHAVARSLLGALGVDDLERRLVVTAGRATFSLVEVLALSTMMIVGAVALVVVLHEPAVFWACVVVYALVVAVLRRRRRKLAVGPNGTRRHRARARRA
jgi:hypothetical protein